MGKAKTFSDSARESVYQKEFDDDRKNGKEPVAPNIPDEIIQKMTQRYVTAYEKTTGNTL